jgi:hypothetical protein
MRYEKYRIIFIGLLFFTLSGCSVQSRFDRLVTRHPYLLESQKIDTIIIKKGNTNDTVFNITKKTDTFFFENTKIIKRDSKIYVYSKVPPCTTNITKTIIQPSKEYIKWKEKNRSQGVNDYLLYLLAGILLAVLIFRK